MFACRFHGWVYDLSGRLVNIPGPHLFTDPPSEETFALTPAAVDCWGGFIFVNLNPRPTCDLRAYLSGVPSPLVDYLKLQKWRWYTGYHTVFRANWKDLMNIQHEGYHATALHQATLGVAFTPDDIWCEEFPGSPGISSLLTVLRPAVTGDPHERLTPVQRVSMDNGRTSNWVENDTSVAAERFPGR